MPKVIPTPRSVDLEVTSRCNAACTYCYYKNNEEVVYEDLPSYKWLQFFKELADGKVMNAFIGGGEPFMRDDIFELLEGLVNNHMRFQIVTNGYFITREVAKRVRETKRLSSIQVSLDGSRAEIHESMRGKGTFGPALDAIKILMEAELPVTVRVTIHAGNIDDLPAIAHLLLVEFGLPAFSTNSISSLGTREKYGDGLFLTPSLRLKAMRILASLVDQYGSRINAAAGPLADWEMYCEMEKARLSSNAIPGRGKLVGCGCIFYRISVRADGAYIPCVMLPQMVLGHIGKDSLEDIWNNSALLDQLRNRVNVPLDIFEECLGCEYLDSCTGNCAGASYSLFKNPNRPSSENCLKKFKRDLAKEGLSLF